MNLDQCPTPDDWAELSPDAATADPEARPTPPPGYAWHGSRLVPSEPDAGRITELFHRYL